MCVIEQDNRQSRSNVKGHLRNVNGAEWQKTADELVGIAKCYGPIVKVILQESTDNELLNFILQYEHIGSAEKFHEHMRSINKYTPTPGIVSETFERT